MSSDGVIISVYDVARDSTLREPTLQQNSSLIHLSLDIYLHVHYYYPNINLNQYKCWSFGDNSEYEMNCGYSTFLKQVFEGLSS